MLPARAALSELLLELDGVQQDPTWHPEGDALFHSLQVFGLARQDSSDPELWAAALLHDVGKAHPGDHEHIGAQLLAPWMPPRVCWLVSHHLDLLRSPAATRRKHRMDARLWDLEQLRRWDEAGRDPTAWVCDVEHAVESILEVARPVRP